MKTTFVIFKKELIDTLRDRRTLVSMILIPLLLFPLLIGISSRIIMSQVRDAQEKVLTVALITHGNAEEFRQMLLKESRVRLIEGMHVDEARALIQKDSLNACVEFAEDFDKTVAALSPGIVLRCTTRLRRKMILRKDESLHSSANTKAY